MVVRDLAAHHLPPSLSDLEALAERAIITIPDELKRHLRNLVIHVDEFPDEEVEEEMGLESPFDILGLYRGVALPQKSVADVRPDADLVFLAVCTPRFVPSAYRSGRG